MQKNEIIEIEITDITSEGNGVGRHEGMAVFVPQTAVGDVIECKIVKVLKSYAYGIVSKILKPSPDRIEPDCPLFPKCGGCSFRHLSYEAELRAKEKFVRDAFTRIGKINCEFEPILGCENPDGYRNKAQYPVSESEGEMICGFYAKRSHRIIGGTKCRLLPEEFGSIVESILEFCRKSNISAYNEVSGKGILRHIYLRKAPATGEVMVCLVVTKNCNFTGLAEKLTTEFTEIKSIVINVNPDNTNVILGKKTQVIWGAEKITDIMCGNVISIAPEAFYQINSPQAERLYGIAEEYAELKGTENLLDLYCGAGTIGLSMAEKVKKLTGVEIVPQAVENAKKNAENSGIDNAEFICADAGKAAESLMQCGECPDVVIMDPPRKGCDKLTLDSVVKMNPTKIIMISCNPSTAARDCAYLSENGYVPVRIRAVDLFPRTGHVECVVLLSQLPDEHIDIDIDLDEFDLTSAESKATYNQIKAYVKQHTGLIVSSLIIAQVKQKYGIIERENYNKAKAKDSRQPKCPPDKENAILDAFRYFKMI